MQILFFNRAVNIIFGGLNYRILLHFSFILFKWFIYIYLHLFIYLPKLSMVYSIVNRWGLSFDAWKIIRYSLRVFLSLHGLYRTYFPIHATKTGRWILMSKPGIAENVQWSFWGLQSLTKDINIPVFTYA